MNEAKEKTALCTSVGADERQSVQNTISSISALDTEINHPDENSPENFEDIMRQMQRMSDLAYLHTVSMNELYETVYQSRPPVIDGLLYSGTYLFAGAPKVGKSFFMAQLAYHISTGQPLWNYEVHQGTVLYLALEDDYQRLQERMSRMFGVEGTDNLHFAVYAKQLGAGLDEQLERFIREHPDTRLIVIDTLQKIREVSTDAYSYANDYDIVGRMKQFADKNGVCLLLVHHTRKQQAGDKFEMISGTTGLLGCADGAFLLQKEKRPDTWNDHTGIYEIGTFPDKAKWQNGTDKDHHEVSELIVKKALIAGQVTISLLSHVRPADQCGHGKGSKTQGQEGISAKRQIRKGNINKTSFVCASKGIRMQNHIGYNDEAA